LLLLGLFFFVLVAGSALAQLPPVPTEPGVNLSASSQTRLVERGACATFDVTVTNSGATVDELSQLPMQPIEEERITFSLSQPAAGWTVSDAPPAVDLNRGDQAMVSVRLCAGENADRGSTTNVVLTAILEPAFPIDEEQRDSVSLRAEVQDAGVFGLPFDLPPWVLWVVLAAVGVMLAAVLVTRKGAGAGVVLECNESNKEVMAGRGTSFPVKIINEGRAKDLVSLTTSPVPHGWDTFLPIVDVPLEAGDKQTVWISVKSPEDAHDGEHVALKVLARSSSAAGQQASIDLFVTVRSSYLAAAGEPAAPSGEHARSVYGPEGEQSAPRATATKRMKF
jgi:hypothetical protein